ncbi:uncharacterized protein METZ01_LOCUS66522 [marine metagenome]|uniref:Uncharacterized protein n=1 Tax=marine metagenome TaxID=408172 RepID=A0A381TDL4_9ZZZZ
MLRLFLIGLLVYCIYRVILILLPILSLRNRVNKEQRKVDIRKQVQKMDIQDAEYEDKS